MDVNPPIFPSPVFSVAHAQPIRFPDIILEGILRGAFRLGPFYDLQLVVLSLFSVMLNLPDAEAGIAEFLVAGDSDHLLSAAGAGPCPFKAFGFRHGQPLRSCCGYSGFRAWFRVILP
jgi:hypothetical protein